MISVDVVFCKWGLDNGILVRVYILIIIRFVYRLLIKVILKWF